MSDSLIDVTISDSFINSIPELVIDSEFKEWLMPLSSEEYEYLERNIIADGCRDPLVVWNGIQTNRLEN